MGCCGSKEPEPNPIAGGFDHLSPSKDYQAAKTPSGVLVQHAGSSNLGKTESTQALPSAPISSNDAAWRLSPSKSLPFDILIRTPNGEVVPQEGNNQVQGIPIYRLIRKIGEGGFAEIYLAENKQRREKVAIKFMERGRDITHVRREILNHSNLSHPQVVQFKEVFIMPRLVGLVMEFIPGGDLFQYLKNHGRLSEDQARWVFQQLTVAVNYCHQHNVINRDLKPENTLVLEGGRPQGKPLIKICDFGYSKNVEVASMLMSKVGTPGYIAPEVLRDGMSHGAPVDYWSLGCILYVMLFGRYPFLDQADIQDPSTKFTRTIHKIMRAEYEFPSVPAISQECRHLIQRLLTVDPAQRATLQDLLADPWFTKDLPPLAFPPEGSASMNGRAPSKRHAYQTPDEINLILDQAERRGLPPPSAY